LELFLNLTSVNRLIAVQFICFTEPVMKFMEGFNYQKLILKNLHFT